MMTIGYHIVIAGYGLWLPGDERGSWSTAWDEELGLIEPHMLHPGDPVRLRMAEERMRHLPVRLDDAMLEIVRQTVFQCADQSDWSLAASAFMPTHTHLLVTYTTRKIDNTVKWLKDQTTKALHRDTPHDGPVWCKGKWRGYIFEQPAWEAAHAYIARH